MIDDRGDGGGGQCNPVRAKVPPVKNVAGTTVENAG
jgi:hypothetical protein